MHRLLVLLCLVLVSAPIHAGHPAHAALSLNELVAKADDDSEAALALADRYENGQGVKADAYQALMWRRHAADLGNVRAQLDLAHRYESGRGAPQDVREAEVWYRRAAAAQDPEARTEGGRPTASDEAALVGAAGEDRWTRAGEDRTGGRRAEQAPAPGAALPHPACPVDACDGLAADRPWRASRPWIPAPVYPDVGYGWGLGGTWDNRGWPAWAPYPWVVYGGYAWGGVPSHHHHRHHRNDRGGTRIRSGAGAHN